MSHVRAALVASTVVVGAALTGCAAQPGTAGVLDGHTVTQASVDRAVEELAPLLEEADPRQVLAGLLVAPLYIDAADENGLGVSSTQVRDQMDLVAEQLGVPASDWSQESVDYVRYVLADLNLQDRRPEVLSAVQQDVQDAEVTVNPRYGRFDPVEEAVVPVDAPWIVTGAGEGDAAEGTGPAQDNPTTE